MTKLDSPPRAIVLSAGRGTRLGALTQDTPKGMLRVEGHPLLEYIVRHLVSQGIADIAINLFYRGNQIEKYLGDGAEQGARIVYSYEDQLLGTAGGAKRLAHFLAQTSEFLVQYGDVVTDQEFRPILEAHRKSGAKVTMLVHQRPNSNSIVEVDASGRVLSFIERPGAATRATTCSTYVNSGIYLCSRSLLSEIRDEEPLDFPRDIFPGLATSGQLYAFHLTGYRCAVDSPARLETLRSAVAEGRCRIALRDSQR